MSSLIVCSDIRPQRQRARLQGHALLLPSNSIVTDWIGELRHGLDLYFVSGIRRLEEKGWFRGLDKNHPQIKSQMVCEVSGLRSGFRQRAQTCKMIRKLSCGTGSGTVYNRRRFPAHKSRA